MALYEKMLLINEQEYLSLKNAKYRVGERGGEEDEYVRYYQEHMGEDDEYPEFGGDYSYYSDDDDDDDYDDPRHPFRYEFQPTPLHEPDAPLAEEEVAEVEADIDDAQNVVEEVV